MIHPTVFRVAVAIAAFGLVPRMPAKEENPRTAVPATFQATFNANGIYQPHNAENVTIHSDIYVPYFALYVPDKRHANWMIQAFSHSDTWVSLKYKLGFDAGRTFQAAINVASTSDGHIDIDQAPGYRTIISGLERNRAGYSGPWLHYFQVQPLRGASPATAGQFLTSASTTLSVYWQLALGSLRNGQSAGNIAIAHHGSKDDWAPLYTPAMLSYESASDEVAIYRVNDIIRQVIANEVAVDIVTLSSTSYEMRCYTPSQVAAIPSTFPRAFNGDPFITYRIEQDGSATALKFTKEARDVTSASSGFPVARREIMTVTRTGTWPHFSWTRSAWTLENQTQVAATTTIGSAGANDTRKEQISVYDPASNTTAFVLERTYANLPEAVEVVASETRGSSAGSPETTNLQYITNIMDENNGLLESVSWTGGRWISYAYYDSVSAPIGRISHEFRPFVNTPSAITRDPNLGDVRHFQYTTDEYGVVIKPALIERRINGTLVEKTTFTYQYNFWYRNNLSVTSTTKTQHTSSGATLTTTLRHYRPDWGPGWTRGQPYSITRPDGHRQAFAYELGTWNGTTFTPETTGTASRTSTITGSSQPTAGAQIVMFNGKEIEETYLLAGKSTLESTIRDSRALVVRTERSIWTGSQWQLTQWTNFTYDFVGRLTLRVSNTGATYSATYSGGLKTSETDEQGVTTTFDYDSAGRMVTKTRQGSGAIGTLVTKYTYDAADNIIEERIGFGQSEMIVTSWQYDDAGRVVSRTAPGLGATTYSYNPGARTVTETRADGATKIESKNLDGSLASRTGTGLVSEYHEYGVETSGVISGFTWHRVRIGDPLLSARWTRKTFDWLGRQTRYEHPGFDGGANYVEEKFYDGTGTAGRLWKTTKTGTAATLYQYNALGQLWRSGLDVNGNNLLDVASNDRITETETYLETHNGAYWLRTDTKTYPHANSSSVITMAMTRTRLTGHPANRLSEVQSLDAEGVLTTETFDVNRNARTAVKTQTRTGLTGSATANFVNGMPTSSTTYDGLTTTTGYDSLLRANTTTDSRSNVTTTVFASGSTRPSTIIDDSNAQTEFSYDNVGRVVSQRDQRNHHTRFSYNHRDQLVRQWGDGAIPVEYGYHSMYGDRITMSTFRGGTGWGGTTWPLDPGAPDTTTWTYDAGSGLLKSKTDALNRTVSQTFCSCGKIESRTLARGVTITYGYDPATGEMTNIGYSDGTPGVTYTFNRMGLMASIADATGSRTLAYDSAKPWRLNSETYGSFYNSRAFTRLYETSPMPGRIRGFQLGSSPGSNADLEQTFGYTAAGRFETLTSGRNGNTASRTFRYG
jgi:YD repeat-containing protein